MRVGSSDGEKYVEDVVGLGVAECVTDAVKDGEWDALGVGVRVSVVLRDGLVARLLDGVSASVFVAT